MSYVFFEDVLAALGQKLSYDAVVNLAGNSFAKDAWKSIMDSNPFEAIKENATNSGVAKGLAGMFGNVKIVKTTKGSYGDTHRTQKGQNNGKDKD